MGRKFKDPEKSDMIAAAIIVVIIGGLLVLSVMSGVRHV
jgi:hypothetical protein